MAQSYSNGGGTGARGGGIDITLTGSFHIGAGNTGDYEYKLLDGNPTTNGQFWFNGGTGYEFVFDFREARIIDEAKWYQDAATTHGTWQWRGWNGSSWVNIGATFTLGGSTVQTQTTLNGNTTAYTKYSLLQTAGSASSSPFLRGIEFQIDVPPAQSYFNTGGQGDRSSSIPTITTAATLSGGTVANLKEGRCQFNGTYSISIGSGQSNISFKFDFGSGVHKRITEIKTWWMNSGDPFIGTYTAQGGTWNVLGSDDDATYVTLVTGLTLGGARKVIWNLSSAAYGYRYFKFQQVGGTTNGSDFWGEVAFQIGTGSADPALTGGSNNRRRYGMMF